MKRLLAILLLLGILGGAIAYNLRSRNAPPAPPPHAGGPGGRSEAVPVTISTVRRRAMRRTLSLIGILRADRQAAVTAKVPARITTIFVREGQSIRRGQLLARLDLGGAQAQVLSAEAGVAAAETQVRKAVEGRRARTVEMDAQIAQAEGGLRTALAKRRSAELSVALTDSAARSDAERAAAAVRQAEAGLRQAETSLAQANDTLKRTQFLYSRGGVARVELEGAQAQADIAKAQRDSAGAGVEQARAAAKPAADTAPLRAQVSEADVAAAQAGVKQAEAGVRNARRAKAEALRLADRDIEAARAQTRQAQAGRTQAAAQVGSETLTSPLDGVVIGLAAHTGEMAQPGMPLMNVVSLGSVYLEASAPARYAAALRPGQTARVTVDTLPNQPLDGEVMETLPVAGPDSRSLPVRIRLAADTVRLTPGVSAKAVVDLATDPNALTIPVDALRNEGNVPFVYVAKEGKAERRNLSLGAMEGQYVQVLSGLAAGDTVILTGPASLQSGMSVQVIGR